MASRGGRCLHPSPGRNCCPDQAETHSCGGDLGSRLPQAGAGSPGFTGQGPWAKCGMPSEKEGRGTRRTNDSPRAHFTMRGEPLWTAPLHGAGSFTLDPAGDLPRPLRKTEQSKCPGSGAQLRLKNWISFSCLRAAASDEKVPRFLRLPVLGSFLRENNRYFPLRILRIMVILPRRKKIATPRPFAPVHPSVRRVEGWRFSECFNPSIRDPGGATLTNPLILEHGECD
jgi:hypothetical protein